MKRKINPNLLGRLIIDLELTDEEVDDMSRNEMFTAVLDYEGYINAADFIKELVLEVYGIDLNNWPEYLAPESAAEMKETEEY